MHLNRWEKGTSFDLSINGKPVLTGKTIGGGKWARLGPWTVEVKDGKLDLKVAKGRANLSGIELWKFGAAPAETRKIKKTPTFGGGGGGAFNEEPGNRPFLVGFRVTTRKYANREVIHSIKPIFETDGLRRLGDKHGTPRGIARIIAAKQGYAIGALQAMSSDKPNGFKAVFMRIAGRSLHPGDSYESPWIGSLVGKAVRLGGNKGRPVVGIHGNHDGEVRRFGLLYLE